MSGEFEVLDDCERRNLCGKGTAHVRLAKGDREDTKEAPAGNGFHTSALGLPRRWVFLSRKHDSGVPSNNFRCCVGLLCKAIETINMPSGRCRRRRLLLISG